MQIQLKVKSSSAEESGGEEGRGECFRTVMQRTAKEGEQCVHRREQGGLSRRKKHGTEGQEWEQGMQGGMWRKPREMQGKEVGG